MEVIKIEENDLAFSPFMDYPSSEVARPIIGYQSWKNVTFMSAETLAILHLSRMEDPSIKFYDQAVDL